MIYFKVRWVVEFAKNEKLNVLPKNQVPYIKDYICILCAVANKYLPPLATGITLNINVYLRSILHVTQSLKIQIWQV